MTLSKEIKDLIEGIHFYLEDALRKEILSGRAESMRKGFLLQLEELKHTYPNLDLSITDNNHNRKANLSYISYVNGDQSNAGNCRLSTSSGSTSYSGGNYSNSSSNGYSGDGVISTQKIAEESSSTEEIEEEYYEEFDDINEYPSIQHSECNLATDKQDDELRLEDNYSVAEQVSFRVIIARCDLHGIITKRSKNFLKNSRFNGVVANGLLYLYNKETDDRQKKAIDLSQYSARNAYVEEKRKKEFFFELVSPGLKTHTFSTTTLRERNEWIEALNRSTQINCFQKRWSSRPISGIILPKHNLSDQDGEVYEELNADFQHSENTVNNHNNTEESKYYEVPIEDDEPKSLPWTINQSVPIKKPERPPLPDILKERQAQSRPLPEAPPRKDDPSIYWEIHADEGKEEKAVNPKLLYSRSLSQEIFDTIEQRNNISSKPKQVRSSEDVSELYDVPNEVNLIINEYTHDCTDNEYQIPTNVEIYQVPPTPIPVIPPPEIPDPVSTTPIPITPEPNDVSEKPPIPSEIECERERKPSSSVRELIAKLNENEAKTGEYFKTFRQNSLNRKALKKWQAKTQGKSVQDNNSQESVVDSQNEVPIRSQSIYCVEGTITGTSDEQENFIAKFAYVGTNPEELSFSRGESILVTDSTRDSWWVGVARGKSGLVQRGYLRKMEDS